MIIFDNNNDYRVILGSLFQSLLGQFCSRSSGLTCQPSLRAFSAICPSVAPDPTSISAIVSPSLLERQLFKCAFFIKQDHRRMNVAPKQTIIFLDHRSLSSIDQKILMKPPPPSSPSPLFSILVGHWRSSGCLLSPIYHLLS